MSAHADAPFPPTLRAASRGAGTAIVDRVPMPWASSG